MHQDKAVKICHWCIVWDSWKRQHHHWHMEHKDTKSCTETLGTNTRNGQVQMEQPLTQWNDVEELWRNNNRRRTQVCLFFSGKEVKHEYGVGFAWSQGHREHCHGMQPSLQQAQHHPPENSPFQQHSRTSVRPNVRPWWQRSGRTLWPATEYHWSDTEEGHSSCARRLECKSGQGCLWKLARDSRTLLQWRNKWERTQTPGVCPILCWRTLLVIT